MQNQTFMAGDTSTHFIEEEFDPEHLPSFDSHEFVAGSIAAAISVELNTNHRDPETDSPTPKQKGWHSRRKYR